MNIVADKAHSGPRRVHAEHAKRLSRTVYTGRPTSITSMVRLLLLPSDIGRSFVRSVGRRQGAAQRRTVVHRQWRATADTHRRDRLGRLGRHRESDVIFSITELASTVTSPSARLGWFLRLARREELGLTGVHPAHAGRLAWRAATQDDTG